MLSTVGHRLEHGINCRGIAELLQRPATIFIPTLSAESYWSASGHQAWTAQMATVHAAGVGHPVTAITPYNPKPVPPSAGEDKSWPTAITMRRAPTMTKMITVRQAVNPIRAAGPANIVAAPKAVVPRAEAAVVPAPMMAMKSEGPAAAKVDAGNIPAVRRDDAAKTKATTRRISAPGMPMATIVAGMATNAVAALAEANPATGLNLAAATSARAIIAEWRAPTAMTRKAKAAAAATADHRQRCLIQALYHSHLDQRPCRTASAKRMASHQKWRITPGDAPAAQYDSRSMEIRCAWVFAIA